MKQTTTFAITINRQLGAGGAYVGQKLSERLNILYADREIIQRAAKELSVLEEDVDFRDEKLPGFWESLFQNSYFAPDIHSIAAFPPTDLELFEAEAKVIRHIASESSAVIIGRCGFQVLKDQPNLVSVYLHSGLNFRCERIQEIFQVSKSEAERLALKNDKERTLYCKNFTGKNWAEAGNYNLSIDTSKLGLNNTVEIIISYLKIRGIL